MWWRLQPGTSQRPCRPPLASAARPPPPSASGAAWAWESSWPGTEVPRAPQRPACGGTPASRRLPACSGCWVLLGPARSGAPCKIRCCGGCSAWGARPSGRWGSWGSLRSNAGRAALGRPQPLRPCEEASLRRGSRHSQRRAASRAWGPSPFSPRARCRPLKAVEGASGLGGQAASRRSGCCPSSCGTTAPCTPSGRRCWESCAKR
mmetsp:Transcript_52159/g.163826  ORF Transcript_52159/g.163826 Transcript_52159/m.163826 type:complete len:206 (+) Transcript_52159:451-1068(+)